MAGAEFPLENRRCERARQWSSLRLDGELSELEGALLDRHLDACPACASFDERLRSAAIVLRLTHPQPPRVPITLPEPEREVVFPVSRRVVVAAVAAALALGSIVGSTLQRPPADRSTPGPQVSLLTSDMSQLREIPRGKRFYPTAPARAPGVPPEGVI
jgi:Putative zinc-finger